MRRGSRPTIDQLVAATFTLVGARLGARPIGDNSAFTHLRTGIDMVRDGLVPAIPRTDPYSFTAFGEPWVVQSWLASFGVGWTDRLGGHGAVIALSAITMGGLAWLIATLARTGRPASTVVAAFSAIAIGLPFWAPRPLLVGLLCFGLTILIVERRHSPLWLLPVVWVWVNSHGSFPLGLLWIGATCVGAWIDNRRAAGDGANVPWRYAGAFVAGLALGAINPLGPRLLTFAGSVFTKREVFGNVVEWKAVDFQSFEGGVCLVGLVVAFVVVARHRIGWRYLLPAAGFLGMGLVAQRNMASLGIVMAPTLAAALRVRSQAPSEAPPRLNSVIAGVLVLVTAVFVVGGAVGPTLATGRYPVRSINWLEAQGGFDPPHRVVTPDSVGNYLELQLHRPGLVFIDDRVDMYPASVSEDYQALLDGGNPALQVLARWRADTVLWHSRTPLVDLLLAKGDWRVAHRERGWAVLERITPE